MERKNPYASIYTENIETTNTMAHNTQVLTTRVISKKLHEEENKGHMWFLCKQADTRFKLGASLSLSHLATRIATTH